MDDATGDAGEKTLFEIALDRVFRRLGEAKPEVRDRACGLLQGIAVSPKAAIEAPGAKEAYARELVDLLFPELRPKKS